MSEANETINRVLRIQREVQQPIARDMAEQGLPLRNGMAPFVAYRKTVLTYAVRMDEPFEVETLEGTMTGQPGDYLAVGVQGEMYPIAASVMDASYEPTR